MKKLLIIYCVFVCCVLNAQHQTFYSQYIYSGLLINPAYAGSQDAINVTSVVRNQWSGFVGAPRSVNFAIHSPLKNKRLNVGLSIVSEKYGISSRTEINGVYAYRIKLASGHLAMGLQGGIDVFRNDWNLIKTTDLNDPSYQMPVQSKVYPKFGAGVYYNAKNFVAGVSCPKLIQFDNTILTNYISLNVFSAYVFHPSEDFSIKSSILIKYIKNSPTQADLTSTFYIKHFFGLGIGYRTKDAAYAFIDLQLNDQLNIGYGYDFTLTSIRKYSGGSHEFMLRYLFKYKINSKSVRFF
jgi:type IX secretion system PorP/SprF family membrane protein